MPLFLNVNHTKKSILNNDNDVTLLCQIYAKVISSKINELTIF